MSPDPAAEAVLRERWSRSQRSLTLFSVVWPTAIALSCGGMSALTLRADTGIGWYAAVPPVFAAIAAVVLRLWCWRSTPVDPASWLPAAFLVAGAQLVIGSIPGYGVAMSVSAGFSQAAATMLFGLCWVLAAAMCISAYRANRILLTPLVPELGSTDVRVVLGVRSASTSHDLVSAHVVVDRDRVELTVRLHRGRSNCPRFDMSVPFQELQQVTPVTLPAVPARRPWVTLSDRTSLCAQAGPAVILTTIRGGWIIPVHDSDIVAEFLNRRRVRCSP